MKNYIDQVREYAMASYTKSDYRYHVAVVVESALKLAKVKKADMEVVEIAALLHDIGRSKGEKPTASKTSDHHISGAKAARRFLKKIGYPDDKAERVASCILAHRGNTDDYRPKTKEEMILYNADAMAHFISFLDLYRCFVEDEGMERGTELIRAKIKRGWSKKLSMSEAKNLVAKEYKAIKLLLDNMAGLHSK